VVWGQRLFKCDRPDEAASALVALIQGYFVLAATARNTIPRGSAAASAKRMAEGLLRPSRSLIGQKARS
jgi:TetR/AcrR family transcriptional repressor of bet genes